MKRMLAALLGLCLLSPVSVLAGSVVAWKSDQGWATGFSFSRDTGSHVFTEVPASLSLSYVYDPTLQGVTQDGTTTFTVDTLTMTVLVPGDFKGTTNPYATVVPGKIAWRGDTIDFTATMVPVYGDVTALMIDVTFIGLPLTPGVLPSSLGGLEGILGNFTVQAQASLDYHGDSGSLGGEVVSFPEPPSAVLLAIAVVLLVARQYVKRKEIQS